MALAERLYHLALGEAPTPAMGVRIGLSPPLLVPAASFMLLS